MNQTVGIDCSRRECMTRVIHGTLSAFVLAALVTGCATVKVNTQSGKKEVSVGLRDGQYFPNMKFKAKNGEWHNINEYRGNYDAIILHFSESWCPYCNAQRPSVQARYNNFIGDNIAFLAISGRDPGDLDKMFTFETYGSRTSPTNRIPVSFLLDKDGIVIASAESAVALDLAWKGRIKEMIRSENSKRAEFQRTEEYLTQVIIDVLDIESTVKDGIVYLKINTKGDAKLVANTDFTITPIERQGVKFLKPMPIIHRGNGEEYFTKPLEFEIPFLLNNGTKMALQVNYAYCIENQCYVGESVVNVPLQ